MATLDLKTRFFGYKYYQSEKSMQIFPMCHQLMMFIFQYMKVLKNDTFKGLGQFFKNSYF